MANPLENVIAQQEGAFEPQRAHTWTITIFGLQGSRDLELALRTGFLPTDGSEEIEIPFMNSRVYVAGKKILDTGSITLVDYVDKNIAGIIAAWRKMVFNPDTGAIGYARTYKKAATITLYAPDFSVERVWRLSGLWPANVNYGAIDYGTSDVVNIELTMRYDNAVALFIPVEAQATLNFGVGGAALP